MAKDLHNYEKRLKTTFKNILDSDKVSDKNKQLVEDFNKWLELREISYSRQYRYLASLKKIVEYNDFRLDNLQEDEESKEKIVSIIRQIQNSEYYAKEYSKKTKAEYKSAIKRLLEFHDLPSDPEQTKLLPKGFTAYVSEKERDHTDPKDLPTPRDVEKLARKLEGICTGVNSIRTPAILMTMWDTGSRVGECLSIKIEGMKVNGRSVNLQVPGNKDSPDRNVPCAVAAPILKNWLENGHPDPNNPDAYLFCKLDEPEEHANYRYFLDKMKKAGEKADIDCKLKGEVNHVFRKGRISYLKKADLMNETMIDKRVGHVAGSDETRTYTRIGDDEAGQAYLSGYDIENEGEDTFEPDVNPLDCSNCKTVNSGHRRSCRSCGEVLDEENYVDGVEVESTVTQDVKDKAGKLRERIIENETPISDERIDEEAKRIVAEEQGMEPEEIEW
ncbi:MAG: tyrosine-type recombinase/integrase [Candidatus Nanohalobium sp.]